MMTSQFSAKLQQVAAMVIFGTIGVVVRYIGLPSSVIAFVRGVVGTVFLVLVMTMRRQKIDTRAVRNNLLALCFTGACLGGNWILLFEGYRFTTVAVATLCYYMAPMFVTLVAPLVLGEKLTGRKTLCVGVSFLGMLLVSGVVETGLPAAGELKGILFGLGAAVLYSCVILGNKKLRDISAMDKTIAQLAISAVVVLPYILLTENVAELSVTGLGLGLLAVAGIVHTGIAYLMYFGSMKDLKAQTVAIFSYIDPVVAILLSAVVLKEQMTVFGMVGAVLILGAALVSELPGKQAE